MFEKGPQDFPHDLLAERALLGCLLVDGSSYDEITDLSLSKEDFFHPQHRLIFDAVKNLGDSNNPIEFNTLCSKLNDLGNLTKIGDTETTAEHFILRLIEDQVTSANIGFYGKTVKEKALLRKIIRTAVQVAEQGMNFQGESKEFISDVESKFFQLTSEGQTNSMKKLSDCLVENLKTLADRQRGAGDLAGIPTGFNKLDERLMGMQPGQLIVVAGRPGMGKTVFGVNLCLNVVKKTNLPVVFFSLEMLAEELSARILSSEAKVDSKKLKMKDLKDDELKKIGAAINRLSQFPLYINDSSNTTVIDMMSMCRRIKAESGLGLIVVDYIQLLRPHTNNPSREQQISEMSRALKQMAKELKCPVIGLSQLNRQVESRPEKRPNVADLRESGALEQDSDCVILLYRDEFYYPDTTNEPGVAEIIVGKNRHGETGTVKLTWCGAHYSFENMAYSSEN